MDDLFNQNQEFLLANLFREVGGIGTRGQKMPTYHQAAEMMERLDRDLIPGEKSFILGRAKKSETAQKHEQEADAMSVGASVQVPICAVNELWHDTKAEGLGKKLDSRYIRNQSVSQKIFEELFNVGMIGSGWLSPKALKELYEEHRILQGRDSVLIVAQEF
jgi:hypothetical protein